jgi:hypothetical protein
MRTTRAARIASIVLSGLLAGCAGSGDGGDDGGRGPGQACTPPAQPTVSFAANVQPIFNASCALGGCHDSATRAQALDLSGNARNNVVTVRSTELRQDVLVRPGRPDDSYLQRKIDGTPPIAGVLMPQGCPQNPLNGAMCLSPDQIAAIRTWITECALAN